MSRLLDVPRALEARGYTPVSGEAVVAVEDPQFPDNAGPFRIRAKGGWVRVERVDAEVKRPVPIGALSAMFTGYLRASDLARAGAIEGDGTVEFLDELFSGPPPWTPDFF